MCTLFLADEVASPSAMALIISLIIFIITSSLFTYRFIPFLLGGVLLFLAVASAAAIIKNNITQAFIDRYISQAEQEDTQTKVHSVINWENFTHTMSNIFDTVVNTLANHPNTPPSPSQPQNAREEAEPAPLSLLDNTVDERSDALASISGDLE